MEEIPMINFCSSGLIFIKDTTFINPRCIAYYSIDSKTPRHAYINIIMNDGASFYGKTALAFLDILNRLISRKKID